MHGVDNRGHRLQQRVHLEPGDDQHRQSHRDLPPVRIPQDNDKKASDISHRLLVVRFHSDGLPQHPQLDISRPTTHLHRLLVPKGRQGVLHGRRSRRFLPAPPHHPRLLRQSLQHRIISGQSRRRHLASNGTKEFGHNGPLHPGVQSRKDSCDYRRGFHSLLVPFLRHTPRLPLVSATFPQVASRQRARIRVRGHRIHLLPDLDQLGRQSLHLRVV